MPKSPHSSSRRTVADLTSLREGRVAKWGGVGCFITRVREKKLLDRGIGGLSLVYDVFPGGSDCKESAYSTGDLSLIPGLGRSPGGGNDNPLQHSCLENFMDRGAWRVIVHSATKNQI